MKRRSYMSYCIVGLVAMSLGCAPPAGKQNPVEAKHDHDHDHDHDAKGPHGGAIVEFGSGDYHAEVVHDAKADEISVYLLDGTAKKPVPVEAKDLLINLMHHGKPEQHTLTPVPQEGDPEGKSSRFVAKDNPELNEDFQHEGANPTLQVMFGDKAHVAKLAEGHGHDHDDDDHGHDHNHKNKDDDHDQKHKDDDDHGHKHKDDGKTSGKDAGK